MTVLTYAYDSFNRADGAPGATEGGVYDWTTINATGTGSWSISGNAVAATSNGSESYLVADTLHSDGSVSAKFVNIVDGGLVFRCVDASNLCMVWATGGVYKIMKKVSGAWTQIGADAGTPVAGDVVRVELDLNSIKLYVNGSLLLSVSDSANNWATKHGFRASASAATYDDFKHESLDKNGIGAGNANIVYSPYTWGASGTDMKTICAGAYFRSTFSGNRGNIALLFTTAGLALPRNIVKYRIDDGPWTRASLAYQIIIPMPSTSTWQKHTIEVYVATAMGTNKWSPQESATIFRGFAGEDTLTTHPINKANLNVCVFGDSITEGYITLKNVSTPDGSDATVSYAGALRNYLGAEVGQVGFGSTGWMYAGAGGVPALPDNYRYLWGGGPERNFTTPIPDLVVINMGTNDDTKDTVATVRAMLSELLGLIPGSTLVAVVVPFNQNQKANLQAAVAEVNNPRVKLVDTAGWYNVSDSSDGIHPYGGTSSTVLAPNLAAALRNVLASATGGLFRNINGTATPVGGVRH